MEIHARLKQEELLQASRNDGSQRALLMACGFCLLVLAGCSKNHRQSLEGTVTLDGKPLSEGSIALQPQPGTQGPSAGGKIVDGRFTIEPDRGTFAGIFRVEITASRKTGRQVKNHMTGELGDEFGQFLPARYNEQSELTADVKADGKNQFEFALRSK